MYKEKPRHPIASFFTWIVLIAASAGTLFLIDNLKGTEETYNYADSELQKPENSGSVSSVLLPDATKKLNIPSWSLFQTGNIWTLISKAKPIEQSFVPPGLVDVPIAHGDASQPMKVSSQIAEPLKKLAAAAATDGHNLAVSSAYRSAQDQQEILDDSIRELGASTAKQYVAEPGKSEHQSGLAVDLSDDTPSCRADSDSCSLGYESTLWLSDNAYKYGFIQRYPAGASSITGVATERWHYRYVGVALAQVMHESHITFDEFVELAR